MRLLVAAAALIATGDALNLPVEGMSRRAAFAKAAALIPLVPLAAFAELKQASDAEVYARADAGDLNAARVIERAKAGKLVDGSSATCSELKDIIAVDRRALRFEKDKLDAFADAEEEGSRLDDQKKIVEDAEKAIDAQIKKLEALEKSKSCPELKQASDREVYERADDNQLGIARVIERAKSGTLVDGSAPPAPSWRRLSPSTRRQSSLRRTSSRPCPTTPRRRRSSRTPRRPSRPRSRSLTVSARRRIATEAWGACCPHMM